MALVASVRRLLNYRRSPRNTLPESLPRYVEDELDKVSATTGNIIEVLQAFETRIAALEPADP